MSRYCFLAGVVIGDVVPGYKFFIKPINIILKAKNGIERFCLNSPHILMNISL